MKKHLLFSALLITSLCVQLTAQTTITTWYVIPPTSGCNGVWAVDASQVATDCGSGPFMYNMNPPGCVNLSGPTVADTTYWQLCAFPCNLTIVDSQGMTCICGTGTSVGQEENSTQRITTTYPNPSTSSAGWNILLREPGNNVVVNIYNSLGQLVSAQSSDNAEQIFRVDTSTLEAGNYIAEIAVNGAPPYRQQLILTN